MRVHVANDFTMKKRSLPLRVLVIQAATCLTIFSLFSFENWSTLSLFDSHCAKLRSFSSFMMTVTIMRSATISLCTWSAAGGSPNQKGVRGVDHLEQAR